MERPSGAEAPANKPAGEPGTGWFRQWLPLLIWLILFSLLWALLSGGAGWYLGLPFVLLASITAVLVRLQSPALRLRALPAFSYFFLLSSLLGAWDVARRTLSPQLRIQPGWANYATRTRDMRARLLLSAIIGLLPGTLASRLDETEGQLEIHLLDSNQDWQATVQRLEDLLDQLFAVEESDLS